MKLRSHPLHHGMPLALGLTALLVCSSALAQADPAYTYFGLSVGSARGSFDDARLASQVLAPGIGVGSTSRDSRSTGYRLFTGYQFNPYYAVELGYHDLGKYSFNASTTPPGTLQGQLKFVGASLDLLGMLPLSDNFSLLARAGAHWTRTRGRFDGTGAALVRDSTPSRRTTNGKYGLGLQYAFSPDFMVRTELERYRVNSATGTRGDVNLISVSLVLPLGRGSSRMASSGAPVYAAAPPPMVEAPRPAPRVMPDPTPTPTVAPDPAPRPTAPARRRVSYSAESTFGFDKSTLQPQGQAALDAFANELRGAEFDMVNVEGHTDRLGSTQYNESLSLQRAEAVKNYLVERAGLPALKVSAKGMGETAPLAQTADCKGDRPTKALIACLQPDRRVDIEVVGTR